MGLKSAQGESVRSPITDDGTIRPPPLPASEKLSKRRPGVRPTVGRSGRDAVLSARALVSWLGLPTAPSSAAPLRRSVASRGNNVRPSIVECVGSSGPRNIVCSNRCSGGDSFCLPWLIRFWAFFKGLFYIIYLLPHCSCPRPVHELRLSQTLIPYLEILW